MSHLAVACGGRGRTCGPPFRHRRQRPGGPPRGCSPREAEAGPAKERGRRLLLPDIGSHAGAVSGEHPREHEGRCRPAFTSDVLVASSEAGRAFRPSVNATAESRALVSCRCGYASDAGTGEHRAPAFKDCGSLRRNRTRRACRQSRASRRRHGRASRRDRGAALVSRRRRTRRLQGCSKRRRMLSINAIARAPEPARSLRHGCGSDRDSVVVIADNCRIVPSAQPAGADPRPPARAAVLRPTGKDRRYRVAAVSRGAGRSARTAVDSLRESRRNCETNSP
jgi:hypothetical protein